MSKNRAVANRLYKLIGHEEFTARSAVDLLAGNGDKFTPHVNSMAFLLRTDSRFIMTKQTKSGLHYKKRV